MDTFQNKNVRVEMERDHFSRHVDFVGCYKVCFKCLTPLLGSQGLLKVPKMQKLNSILRCWTLKNSP
jgi:hypothetical protein